MGHHKKFLSYHINFAKSVLKKEGSLTPMFVGDPKVGKGHVIMCPWEDEETKRKSVVMVRLYFIAHEIHEYLFMCEAWASKLKSGQKPLPGLASADPNRVEALLVIRAWRENEKIISEQITCEMIRDKKGKFIDLKIPTDEPNGHAAGTFVEMLPPHTPSHQDVAKAKTALKMTIDSGWWIKKPLVPRDTRGS